MARISPIKPWLPRDPQDYNFVGGNIVHYDAATKTMSTVPTLSVTTSGNVFKDVCYDGLVNKRSSVLQVDLAGKFLCPGLIDSHVHLVAVPGENTLGGTFGMPHDVSLLRQPFHCRQILHRGFTTVRDCGGATLALKQAITDQVFQGPRVFMAGHALSQTGGHGDLRGSQAKSDCCGAHMNNLARVCDGVAECRRAARDELRQGADFLKIMAGGGVASPTDKLDKAQFEPDEIRAITDVARRQGTYVTAHAYTPESIMHALDNGCMGIEHGNFITPDVARKLADKGAFLTPTLATYGELGSPEWKGFLPPESAVKNESLFEKGLEGLRVANEAGVTICYGTDLLGPLTVAQTREFSHRSRVLSSEAILRSATVNPARMLGQENYLGQIAPGFAADFLILDADPVKDITVLDRPEIHLLAVIQGGQVCMSRLTELPVTFP